MDVKMNKKNIVIFGTGSAAEAIGRKANFPIDYFVDNDASKWGKTFLSKFNVFNPNQLLKENADEIGIIIASSYFNEISIQLTEMGFLEHKHYWDGLQLFEQEVSLTKVEDLINGLIKSYDIPLASELTFDAAGKQEGVFTEDKIRSIRTAFETLKVLEVDYGHKQTSRDWSCVDSHGQPIPWYTYPAIEYIKNVDFSDKVVFEYGSGNSTLFWGDMAKKVISVEDNEKWYQEISKKILKNNELHFIQDESDYINFIYNFDYEFDLIVIDGSHRPKCVDGALKKLKRDGLIILDNSDWYANTSAKLREADLIQVDMAGFNPIASHVTTTSFFLTREVSLRPRYGYQPYPSPGSIKHNADAD